MIHTHTYPPSCGFRGLLSYSNYTALANEQQGPGPKAKGLGI
jgi:hypothetical protein